MKFPICPYCRTAYDCKALAEIKRKNTVCRYCGKQLHISRYLAIIPVLSICIALIIFNTAMLCTNDIKSSDLRIIIIANAVTIFSALIIAPLMIRFEKMATTIPSTLDNR